MFEKNRIALIVAAVLGIAVAPSAMAALAKVAVNQSNSANVLQLGCFGFRWHIDADASEVVINDVLITLD